MPAAAILRIDNLCQAAFSSMAENGRSCTFRSFAISSGDSI
jgi:hypothetical protein